MQQVLALRKQMHLHFPPVPGTRAPADEPAQFATGNQGHHGMRLGLQTLGELTDIGVFTPRITLDVQEHQILQRSHPVGARRPLGESLETAQLITKFR